MKPAFFAPRAMLDKKPPHGDPCNSCGLCCVATICPLGQHIFKTETGPCPALEMSADGNSKCGVVANPMAHAIAKTIAHGADNMSAAASILIGSGTGCDARFNGEPINHPFYDVLRQWDHDNRVAIKSAKKMWGIK